MPTYAYTGTLADIGMGLLTGKSPQMWVRPEREAFGPDGLISALQVDVVVDPATGAFTMDLLASTDMSPSVKYVIEVGRFEETFGDTAGEKRRFHGADTWTFFAAPGGGPVAAMIAPPAGSGRTWVGTTPPPVGGYDLWIDTSVSPPLLKEAS